MSRSIISRWQLWQPFFIVLLADEGINTGEWPTSNCSPDVAGARNKLWNYVATDYNTTRYYIINVLLFYVCTVIGINRTNWIRIQNGTTLMFVAAGIPEQWTWCCCDLLIGGSVGHSVADRNNCFDISMLSVGLGPVSGCLMKISSQVARPTSPTDFVDQFLPRYNQSEDKL